MRIINSDSDIVSIAYSGETYQAVGPGVFEVPQEVGTYFVGFPDWRIDDGTDDSAAVAETPSADSPPEPTETPKTEQATLGEPIPAAIGSTETPSDDPLQHAHVGATPDIDATIHSHDDSAAVHEHPEESLGSSALRESFDPQAPADSPPEQ